MPTEKIFTDQLGRRIVLRNVPKRIVSIVPSQTELLFSLGFEDSIAGITKFCVHPADKVKNITKVGGTKKLDIELIKSLNPDLIIANKEENHQAQVEELIQHFPVWVSDIADLSSALIMIRSVGELTDKIDRANSIISEIERSFNDITPIADLTVVYMIWRKPYMIAGKDTFIKDMLQKCGFRNIVPVSRYPEIEVEQIVELNPQVIFLSSEPYPFNKKHAEELQQYLPGAKICLVDGEMFSWYGSRLLYAAGYFKWLMANVNG